ncbi:MAG: methionine--tRNA ligase [Deltaproteobacteria bacterium]|nr:MAG: methionine--tRNA ligase [Deltaproteobacteria bacterium]
MKYIVTAALPYANGPLHLGHLLEHIQADIFVKALRMDKSNTCFFICGADVHGTPIEINAAKQNEDVLQYVERWRRQHEYVLKIFGIEFTDGYRSSHCIENKKNVEIFFLALKAKGEIVKEEVSQLYDEQQGRFLPDRYVQGECPYCFSKNQYGDICDICNSVYKPTELLNPISVLSGTVPNIRVSDHYFFKLKKYAIFLEAWIESSEVFQPEIREMLKDWFKKGLKDWDITRDPPYFGFLIPEELNKYFYVWLDAPISYISLCEKSGCLDLWTKKHNEKEVEIIHFIGKDIVYFHALFWPAILQGMDYRLPTKIYVHGMVTVGGAKMSKSKNTFILAEDFLKNNPPEFLRFYFASKLSLKIEDIDFSFQDFVNKTNSDIVFSIVNLLSRVIKLLNVHYASTVCNVSENTKDIDLKEIKNICTETILLYYSLNTFKIIKYIMALCTLANKYVQDKQPWSHKGPLGGSAHEVLSISLWVSKVCVGLLKPIMPIMVGKVEKMLNLPEITWNNILDMFPTGHKINLYEKLATPLSI